MPATILSCPHCGKRNRVQATAQGVVDFWAPWCGPCRMVSPAVERLATEHAGHLKVVKLNVDEAPDIGARYGVQGIPTLLFLRNGTEVDRVVGAPPEPQLKSWLTRHLSAASGAAGSA